MKQIGAWILFLVTLLLVTFPRAGLADESPKLAVTWKATLTKTPDVCYVLLYVKGDGVLMVDAAKALHDRVEAVSAAVRAKVPNIKDIQVTLHQAGEKETRWSSDQGDKPPVPQVVAKLIVTLSPNEALAYDVLDAAMRAGAVLDVPSSSRYSGEVKSAIVYGLADQQSVEDELRKAAFDGAKMEAHKVAAVAGKALGSVASVTCYAPGGSQTQYCFDWRTGIYPTRYVGTDPRTLDVTYTLTVSFEYEN